MHVAFSPHIAEYTVGIRATSNMEAKERRMGRAGRAAIPGMWRNAVPEIDPVAS